MRTTLPPGAIVPYGRVTHGPILHHRPLDCTNMTRTRGKHAICWSHAASRTMRSVLRVRGRGRRYSVPTTEPVTINLDADAARIFKNASPEQRRKLELLISLQLRSASQQPAGSLTEVMDAIGRKAQERGLTPEILEEILRDE